MRRIYQQQPKAYSRRLIWQLKNKTKKNSFSFLLFYFLSKCKNLKNKKKETNLYDTTIPCKVVLIFYIAFFNVPLLLKFFVLISLKQSIARLYLFPIIYILYDRYLHRLYILLLLRKKNKLKLNQQKNRQKKSQPKQEPILYYH